MIDIILQYQASIFVNASDIQPNPDTMTRLITLFRDKELIPSTFQEIGPKTPNPTLRLRMSSSNNEWAINFASERIDIEKTTVGFDNERMGDIEVFYNEVCALYERILGIYTKKANRLSLISGYMLEEMGDVELNEKYFKLFSPPKFYVDNPPFEWNWRSASKYTAEFLGEDEYLNVITAINRAKGQLGKKGQIIPIDRIHLQYDINTVPENQDFRFEMPNIRAFLESVSELQKQFIAEQLEYLNE